MGVFLFGWDRDPADATGPVTEADVAAQLAPMLGVFRRAQTTDEVVAGADAVVQPAPSPEDGENLRLLRHARPGGRLVQVWPAREAVCFAVSGGAGCAPIQLIRDAGATVGTYVGQDTAIGRVRVGGIVIDGVTSVTIELIDGSTVATPVADNGFVVDVAGAPATLRWSTLTGAKSMPIPFETEMLSDLTHGEAVDREDYTGPLPPCRDIRWVEECLPQSSTAGPAESSAESP
ncbi:MAG TPA: hypothetical protein VNT32_00710 [Thermoleophilaceae bacterium]|nr:hypothetical protein [Thermoleophilaceae bacterium]